MLQSLLRRCKKVQWRLICAVLGFLPLLDVSSPSVRAADSKSRVAIDLFVDRIENRNFASRQEEESGFKGYFYDVFGRSRDGIQIWLADGDIMGLWKGDAPIRQDAAVSSINLFESPHQFAPVFLVIDVINKGPKAAQIVGGYLDVGESARDLQPFFVIAHTYDPYCGVGEGVPALETSIEFINYGWGAAQQAQIAYSFGDKTGMKTDAFVSPATPGGDFANAQTASISDGLKSSGVNIQRLKTERFTCASIDEVPRCARDLAQSGLLGNLLDAIFTDGIYVLTRVSGALKYNWADSHGKVHQRLSPFSVDMPLIEFDTGLVAECGAGGPVERPYQTVKLPTDQQNYRIPLPYKGKLGPRQNRRLALSLVADKSSQHIFRVVFQLADGSTAVSPKVDLLYFMPRFPYIN